MPLEQGCRGGWHSRSLDWKLGTHLPPSCWKSARKRAANPLGLAQTLPTKLSSSQLTALDSTLHMVLAQSQPEPECLYFSPEAFSLAQSYGLQGSLQDPIDLCRLLLAHTFNPRLWAIQVYTVNSRIARQLGLHRETPVLRGRGEGRRCFWHKRDQ